MNLICHPYNKEANSYKSKQAKKIFQEKNFNDENSA